MALKSLKPKKKIMKRAIASIVFTLLGRAVKACYRLDSRVKKEFDELSEGIIVRMFIKPSGPFIMLKKEGGKIISIKDKTVKPTLDIQFKSVESALFALTGTKSVAACYFEERFIVFGDLADGTAFIRIMNIVESYLFPKIWTAFLLNNQVPVRERYQLRIYMATLFGI